MLDISNVEEEEDTESNQNQKYYKHISLLERDGDKSYEVDDDADDVDDDIDHNTHNINSLINTPATMPSS